MSFKYAYDLCNTDIVLVTSRRACGNYYLSWTFFFYENHNRPLRLEKQNIGTTCFVILCKHNIYDLLGIYFYRHEVEGRGYGDRI